MKTIHIILIVLGILLAIGSMTSGMAAGDVGQNTTCGQCGKIFIEECPVCNGVYFNGTSEECICKEPVVE